MSPIVRVRRRSVLALLVAFAAGAMPGADRVDEFVRAEMERQHIPGLALAILKNGEPVRLQGYGVANLEHGIPVTPRTVFKIASLSKQFLAAGMLLLQEEGKISLSDSVRKYLDDAPEAWGGITIRHILSHTSGLVRESPAFDALRPQSDAAVVRRAYSIPLAFRPGEKWQYSNVGYFAAAEIIRRVSGEPWPEFIAGRLFEPAGMKDTRGTTTVDLVPNRAGGYEWQDGHYQNAREYIALRPSGAFLSTIDDLARWDSCLYREVPLRSDLRELMWKPVRLNDGSSAGYGLGWRVEDRGNRRAVSHGGTLPGFRSFYVHFPDERLSVIVLTNCGSAEPEGIGWKIAAEWFEGQDPAKEPAAR